MFSTVSAGYCVTPSREPFSRLPSRASTIIRDVRRKSLRIRRTTSFRLDTTPGTFVRLCEDEVREKYVEEIVRNKKKLTGGDTDLSCHPEKSQRLETTPETPLEEEDKENNNFVTPGPRSSIKRRCSSFFSSSKRKRLSRTVKNLGPSLSGSGESYTVMAGYMYKKCGTSRHVSLPTYRRKYVCLTSSGVLSYYNSFQSYLDNSEGKHINLAHTTVKIPGQVGPGTGLSTRDSDNDTCHVHEMVILSLDNKHWQFQLCSVAELEQWVSAIEQQISRVLSDASHVTAEHVARQVAGNDTCADCGHPTADWASVNLGIVICIQCSGIHRNLGTHVSKVRSLRLDTWSETQLHVMKHVGNSLANRLWEHHLDMTKKPGPNSSRAEKEQFIMSKYVYKCWLRRNSRQKTGYREDLVTALEDGDMETVLEILIHHAKDISGQFPFGDKALASLLLKEENLFVSQLLAWFKGFSGDQDDEEQDIVLHQPGNESILL